MSALRRTIQRQAPRIISSLAVLGLGGMATPACLNRPIEPIEPRTTSTLVEKFSQTKVDKINLLLTIDDSRSMADKQAILARAVPDLIGSLVNPPCLGQDQSIVSQPGGPLETCPAGSHREFEPVIDIHIGIVSTSLGARGSVSCTGESGDDQAHLVHDRLLTDGTTESVDTYAGLGFLAWDPAQKLSPAGTATTTELIDKLTEMVKGVDQQGCGYEAQLESWYRFLINPEPYASLEKDSKGRQSAAGVDSELLAERANFLRADSLVAIVMLTDENDCSFRATGQGWLTGEADPKTSGLYPLKARAECATDPDSACCAPCGHEDPSCPADPTCAEPATWDHAKGNLNCFNQKQRYGVDLLYPTDRYVTGLTSTSVMDRAGNIVDNPLFVAPDGTLRPTDRVFLAGVVGVPWQDVARTDDTGKPSLKAGLKTAAELAQDGVWDVILGDPATGKLPLDAHMIESISAREGSNPITGDRIAASSAAAPNADGINGHEYVPDPNGNGDLQYACIFDLPQDSQVDCNDPGVDKLSCDCGKPALEQKPLCQASDGSYSSVQVRAKAYPGLRHLSVLRGVGDQAIVGSICPQNLSDDKAPDFGYRPAIGALTTRLKEKLGNPCLARTFTPDENGQVSCIMLEGRRTEQGESCDCSGLGRRPVGAEHAGAVAAAEEDDVSVARMLDCFCEIPQLEDAELDACQSIVGEPVELNGAELNGWCYVDATTMPPIGNPELVAGCSEVEKRTIRFLGAGRVQNEATLFLTCQQESQ